MRNLLVLGWNTSRTGRESISAAHFAEVIEFLTAHQKEGRIAGFEPVFLEPYGGGLQGFFLVRGTPAQLDSLQNHEVWIEHVTRAILHLDAVIHQRGTGGEAVMQLMGLWTKHLPK